MNVYVIYKFANFNEVKEEIEKIKQEISNISFFYFDANKKHFLWHKRAKSKMKKCDMVAFFDYIDESEKSSFPHIRWELKLAEKYKKRIIVFKKNTNSYSPKIYEKDYSEQSINKLRYKVRDVENAVSFFKEEFGWRVENNLICKTEKNESVSFDDKKLLLEQYRIMIETSEKLMERRQATGNLYTTICTALIALIGASFGFGNFFVSSIASFLSGIIIIILCNNWRSSITAYELNNAGKFAVINEIEKHLPADMFECEYRYNTLNGIRSYSTREKILPALFIVAGAILILLAVGLFLLNFI